MSSVDLHAFERQHAMTWIFETWRVVRVAVLPAVAYLVFGHGFVFGWLVLPLALPAVAVSFARYLALSYSLDSADLVVRDGILQRNERRIPFSRIQNLDEVQGLLHRIFGAIAVRVETAGGSKPEAVLHLSPVAAARLRAAIFSREDEVADAELERPPMLKLTTGDLVRLGLIQNRGFVLLAAAIGAVTQLDWIGVDDSWWEWAAKSLPDLAIAGWEAYDFNWLGVGIAALAVLVAAYAVLSAFSIAISIVRYHGFTVRHRDDNLQARYGLLTRVQKAVPRARIQRLKVEETLLHRVFRRLSIRLDTAGGGDESRAAEAQGLPGSGRQWLAPVTVRPQVHQLVATAMPKLSLEPLEALPAESAGDQSSLWNPISQRAPQRMFNKAVLAMMIVTFALVWVSPWALLLLVLTPALWWICRNYVRHRHYSLTRDALWWKKGWLSRELTVIPFEKIQSVRFRESPFDRRHRMGRVIVDTARSGISHAASISYLEVEEARQMAERLAAEAARSAFVWS